MRSGKYVQIQSQAHLKRIYKHYKVSKTVLKNHNPRKFIKPGEWIFIPMRVGMVGLDKNPNQKMISYGSGGVISTKGFLWPVPRSRNVSSFYGRRYGRHHDGIDISAPRGTGFVAAKSGKVIYSGWMNGYGKVLIVKHPDAYYTVYAHASKLFFSKGDEVSKGQKIGKVGATGRATGPHLHFEIRHKNKHVNPFNFISNHKFVADGN
jgi:murein DD-endopeptidase MepM/ murein hydrolase activator NlpD